MASMRLTVANKLNQRGFSPKTYIFKIENMKGQPRKFAEAIKSRIYRDTKVDAYIGPFSVHETTIIKKYEENKARILLSAIHALEDELGVMDRFDGFFMFTEHEDEDSDYLQTVIFVITNGVALNEHGYIQNNNVNGNCTCYIVSDINLGTIDWEPIDEFELISTLDFPPQNGHES